MPNFISLATVPNVTVLGFLVVEPPTSVPGLMSDAVAYSDPMVSFRRKPLLAAAWLLYGLA